VTIQAVLRGSSASTGIHSANDRPPQYQTPKNGSVIRRLTVSSSFEAAGNILRPASVG